jgi:spore maturation protein CgeB
MVLRGPVLTWWIDRQNRRLDQAYLTELIRAGRSPDQPRISVDERKNEARPLRQILLIADCLWEPHQLVPELNKIAPVVTWDLADSLAPGDTPKSAPPKIRQAIRHFIERPPSAEPDVILLYARASLLSEEAFALLRRRWRCPLLGMNLDDKTEFFAYGIFSSGNAGYSRWARCFDLNLTSSLTAATWYRQAGLPCRYIAMGFHASPEIQDPPRSPQFEHAITFVGSRKPERERWVHRLRTAGIPLTTFGTGWPASHRVDNPEAIYRASQLNLGLGQVTTSGGIVNLKARDFECPGAGGCYLTTYNWELAHHYDIGREILCYRSFEDLVEMYFYYAQRPAECLEIAQAAHRRCQREHTWEHRFRTVFRELGFPT